LVASFLGATTVKAKGLHGFSWAALVALVLGLVVSDVLLSNWKLRFALDAPDFYAELYDEAAAEAETETLGWLVSAAYGYHGLRRANASVCGSWASFSPYSALSWSCRRSFGSWPSGRICWMAPRPIPPDKIKTPSIKIGIEEGRGGSARPAPRPTDK
jgi:hypothetical protein